MQVVFDIFIKIFKTRLTAVCALCYKIHKTFDTFPQEPRATHSKSAVGLVDNKFGFVHPILGADEIPLLGEMSRSDKGIMAQP